MIWYILIMEPWGRLKEQWVQWSHFFKIGGGSQLKDAQRAFVVSDGALAIAVLNVTEHAAVLCARANKEDWFQFYCDMLSTRMCSVGVAPWKNLVLQYFPRKEVPSCENCCCLLHTPPQESELWSDVNCTHVTNQEGSCQSDERQCCYKQLVWSQIAFREHNRL